MSRNQRTLISPKEPWTAASVQNVLDGYLKLKPETIDAYGTGAAVANALYAAAHDETIARGVSAITLGLIGYHLGSIGEVRQGHVGEMNGLHASTFYRQLAAWATKAQQNATPDVTGHRPGELKFDAP